MDPIYFPSRLALRRWFEQHHATARELIVGYYKKHTGRAGLTYPESVDEALCFGWIDGVRHTVDTDRYVNRFTPRRPGSHWSQVNIRRVEALIREGRMTPAGLAAFEARKANRTGRTSYEQRPERFDRATERTFRAHPEAWAFFQSQPPSYRRLAIWWVVSAIKPETRARRLETLIADSAAGRRLGVAGGNRRPPAKSASKRPASSPDTVQSPSADPRSRRASRASARGDARAAR
ncbi:MAG TPA: YdeI/OmpD-associated family protein [Vicinamibacterales bacterium]